MPSQLGAGRPFGTKKWKPYVPDDSTPTLKDNAARTAARMNRARKKQPPKRA